MSPTDDKFTKLYGILIKKVLPTGNKKTKYIKEKTMRKMTRNEFLISTLKEIAEKEKEENVKFFIDNIELNNNEKNSLYAKCINEIKKVDKNNDKFIENYKIICDKYLNMEKGKSYYKVKYDNDIRKKYTKQLNMDIDKELMEEFNKCLKKNNHTKKSVIVKAIEDYIAKNK